MLKGEVIADVVLEALSTDDWPVMLGLSKWMSMGAGERPRRGVPSSWSAMTARCWRLSYFHARSLVVKLRSVELFVLDGSGLSRCQQSFLDVMSVWLRQPGTPACGPLSPRAALVFLSFWPHRSINITAHLVLAPHWYFGLLTASHTVQPLKHQVINLTSSGDLLRHGGSDDRI